MNSMHAMSRAGLGAVVLAAMAGTAIADDADQRRMWAQPVPAWSHSGLEYVKQHEEELNVELPPVTPGVPLKPLVDLVFVVDTSGSLEARLFNEFAPWTQPALGRAMDKALRGLVASTRADLRITTYAVDNNVPVIRDFAPFGPALGLPDVLGRSASCFWEDPAVQSDEDWAYAVGVVAEHHRWRAEAARVIVPISDEGALSGDGCEFIDIRERDDEGAAHDGGKCARRNGARAWPIAIADDFFVPAPGDACSARSAIAMVRAQEGVGALITRTPSAEELFWFLRRVIGETTLPGPDCDGDGVPDALDPWDLCEGCDSIDFNNDGSFPDAQDLDIFLDAYLFPSVGSNSDGDFNNDWLIDAQDVEAFLSVLAGGPCVR